MNDETPVENRNGTRHMERIIRWALAALAAILLALFAILFVQYQAMRNAASPNQRELRWSWTLERRAPLPVSEAPLIHAWMTFDYVNYLFALPPSYLRTRLGIGDVRYPRLGIGDYAEKKGMNVDTFLSKVQAAVRGYEPAAGGGSAPSANAPSGTAPEPAQTTGTNPSI